MHQMELLLDPSLAHFLARAVVRLMDDNIIIYLYQQQFLVAAHALDNWGNHFISLLREGHKTW